MTNKRANIELVITFEKLHDILGLPSGVDILWVIDANTNSRRGILRLSALNEHGMQLEEYQCPAGIIIECAGDVK